MKKLIISFESTHHAIKMEMELSKKILTKTIPTPRTITASCGLTIMTDLSNLQVVESELDKYKEIIYVINKYDMDTKTVEEVKKSILW